ncbi:MAG: ABC-F family ATP-binding cassette domain-containing protein [Chlorobi bacterium]|nr:ABC-F family ATP-binding cassette domain-containing protein [Chlorobiota bacterium]
MNYLSAENLSKHYGELILFENISFGLNKGDKVALIARNGTGKSSLLKIIAGLDTPDDGSYIINKDISFAFLSQQPEFDDELTIDQLFETSHSKTLQIIRNYEAAIEKQTENYNNQTQAEVDKASEMMDRFDAWDYEERVKQMLSRFGLHDTGQSIKLLSGGQKKRLALAFTLLDKPDMLFLDEPTNHLDINMIEWLEEYLSSSATTLLMVTHDRYFLDKVCNSIMEMTRGNIYTYRGNYAYFLEKKAERQASEQKSIDTARNFVRKEIDWMRRMPKARTTKSKSRIDSFYKKEEIAKSGITDRQLKFDVQAKRIGNKILELKNVSKSYGGKHLINNLSYTFKKGEKIGIVGANGCGKSTLLNIITAQTEADSGSITKGETISYGYYRQDGLKFDKNKKVIDILSDIAEVVKIGKNQTISVSSFLTHFLFEPKVQNNYVYTLSGGELRRLYLLTVLIKSPNFLILDEPTNDLDIETLNILEDFLASYPGCVILVSHDRYLMDKLVDHIFIFKGEGEIKDFYGNYTEYQFEQKRLEKQEKKIKTEGEKQEGKQSPKRENEKPKTRLTFKENLEHKQLEQDIAELENEKAKLEDKLNSGKLDYDDLEKTSIRVSEIIDILDDKTLRWMELEEFKD